VDIGRLVDLLINGLLVDGLLVALLSCAPEPV